MSDDGGDDASVLSGGRGRTNYGQIMELPVLVDGVKPRNCVCCGEGSDSASPLEDAAPDDRYGGKRPWMRYGPAPSAPTTHKVVVGKVCMICNQVYRILGLHLTHGTLQKYLSSVTPKPEEHRAFLRSDGSM